MKWWKRSDFEVTKETHVSAGWLSYGDVFYVIIDVIHIEGILPKGPYPPCVSMAGRALLAGYPQYMNEEGLNRTTWSIGSGSLTFVNSQDMDSVDGRGLAVQRPSYSYQTIGVNGKLTHGVSVSINGISRNSKNTVKSLI